MAVGRFEKKKIIEAIREAEKKTSGEIRVHLQSRSGEDAFREAQKVFNRLKMYKTRHRNAVLIFVAVDSRKFAILGDRGIHERVGEGFWAEVRDAMGGYFSAGDLSSGVAAGVRRTGEELGRYFPRELFDRNELSNEVTQN